MAIGNSQKPKIVTFHFVEYVSISHKGYIAKFRVGLSNVWLAKKHMVQLMCSISREDSLVQDFFSYFVTGENQPFFCYT